MGRYVPSRVSPSTLSDEPALERGPSEGQPLWFRARGGPRALFREAWAKTPIYNGKSG
jgi:hypothetical protein